LIRLQHDPARKKTALMLLLPGLLPLAYRRLKSLAEEGV
jgi:hypothetical protein